jgi:plasmid stabilization system protein ParE
VHAENDLVRVASWYAERHPGGHERFLRDFRGVLEMLRMFPHAGRERDELRPNIRSSIAHPYVVFYRVDDAARTITIVRVLHGRMDLDPDEIEGL